MHQGKHRGGWSREHQNKSLSKAGMAASREWDSFITCRRSKLRADNASLQAESLLRWGQRVPLFLVQCSSQRGTLNTPSKLPEDANSKHEQTHSCLACETLTVLGSCSEHQVHRWDPPPLLWGAQTPVWGAEICQESCWCPQQCPRWGNMSSLSWNRLCLYYLLFSLTLNVITHTLPILLLLSAPVKADVQSSLHNFFLLSCLQDWQTFSCRPRTHSGAHQLFPVKTDCLLLSVTIVGTRSE